MVNDQRIKFYLTPAHDCSYFGDRKATTLFADPRTELGSNDFAILTENGFRRSGDYIYRPHCEDCQACESLRILVEDFRPSKSQKRIIKNNQDISVEIKEAEHCEEYFYLYESYINTRHNDGDMYPATDAQFRSFLLAPMESCRFIEFRKNGRLIAVSVVDVLPNALSAIYTFFDPEESARSLGTYAVLWQIEHCLNQGFAYLYLGYFIKDSDKMNYKDKFKPFQLYRNDYWQAVE
jgi:arginine-tRNA-protein transferase